MNNSTIDGLKQALIHSPENIPLRLLLAEALAELNRLEEAEVEYNWLVKKTNDPKCKVGLATVYFKKNNYSACNVILEELIEKDPNNMQILTLYSKALVKENALEKAISIYKRVLLIDPNYFDEELDSHLRVKYNAAPLHDFDDEVDDNFLQKPSINFKDVGGMESVKKEIDLKIIKPILHPALYKSYGKKIGGGILLFGPPGCGKTYIAKATAGQVNAKFISISLNNILDMWIGNSEKNLHELFELARHNTPCIVFIDEIDALGASRGDMKQSSGRHLINQFLQELDGIDSTNDGIMIIGATNMPWNLDAAFRRPGRFDRIIFIPPPDEMTRVSILKLKLKDKPIESIDYEYIAKKIENYSGADIDAIIDIAIELKLESSFATGVPQPITTQDLMAAIKRHKPSTIEWFSTAKNYAMFANDSGLYDDILTYLKIKK